MCLAQGLQRSDASEHSGNNYDIMLNIKHSGKFYILLDDSTEFQNLLKASIGMEKKILERSGLFSKVQEPSR